MSSSLTQSRPPVRGCYVTVPTLFRDPDLELDLPAVRRHVRFLIEGGIQTGTGVLLAGGAAGDFSTLTFDERIHLAEAVVDEANGRVPVAMGAQTTSTRELIRLAQAAERVGADYIQVSAPFYFHHTQEDIYEHVRAGAEAAQVGVILYNTFWTSSAVERDLLDRLLALPNLAALKWAVADTGFMQYDRVVAEFAPRVSIIDNQARFITSHMSGARGLEVHICNHWPQWGVRLFELLESRQYELAHHEMIRVALPFYKLWAEMEKYTAGDGYLDKLCMELVGLGSSRCRPPTRDVRDRFREQARRMLEACGVPNVLSTAR